MKLDEIKTIKRNKKMLSKIKSDEINCNKIKIN